MPHVVVHVPGVRRDHTDEHGEEDAWTFNATVDGRHGVISIVVGKGEGESYAAGLCHRILVADPSQLDGILITGGGGAGGGGHPAGAGDGGGGGFGHDIPRTRAADEEEGE